MEKLLGIPEVYMKIIMDSNYKQTDIFYTSEQLEAAVASAYPDMDREIVSDYRGIALQRALRCCYEDLGGEIVLPCQVGVIKKMLPFQGLSKPLLSLCHIKKSLAILPGSAPTPAKLG